MRDDILGDKRQSLVGAHNRFELRPLGLELFLALNFFPFSGFLETGIDTRAFVLIESEPWQACSRSRWEQLPYPGRPAGCRKR